MNKYHVPTETSGPSYFKSVADKEPKVIPWDKVVEWIRTSEKVKNNTIVARDLYKNGNQRAYAKYKAANGAITPAAVCEGGHSTKDIIDITKKLMVDLDNIKLEEMQAMLEIIRSDSHTFIAYTTCSGQGIRVIAPYTVAENEVAYIDAWRWGNQYYSMITGLEHDKATKDASRLSYLSHDPDCYYNPDARPFFIDNSPHEKVDESTNGTMSPADPFAKTEEILSRQGMHFTQGQRHHYIINAAFLLNKMGVDCQQVIDHYASLHDDPNEVAKIVNWAYNHSTQEHGSWLTTMPKKNVVRKVLVKKTNNKETPTDADTPSRTRNASPQEIRAYINENIMLRFNTISTMLEHCDPDTHKWSNVDDRTLNALWEDACNDLNLYVRQADFISEIHSQKTATFDPFAQYFDSLPPWHDGDPDYIGELASRVETTTKPELFDQCFRKWIVALVASWLQVDVTNQTILTFIGGQGKFKSTFFRLLLPPELQRYFLAKGNSNYLTKDDKLAVTNYGIICLEEIDSMKDADLNAVKALVTTVVISERAAYARTRTERPHVASFCATGNNKHFLTDLTGNRRWLPFEITSILDPYANPINYAGLYSQVLYLLNNGFKYWFSREEDKALEDHKKGFAEPCPEEELVMRYFRKPKKQEVAYFKSTAEITARCKVDWPMISPKRIGMVLTRLGFVSSARRGVKGYIVVERDFEEIRATQISDAAEVLEAQRPKPQPPQQRTILQDIEEQENPFLS